jgi:hypothetical protein
MATTDQRTQLDRLASIDAGPFPVVSLFGGRDRPNETIPGGTRPIHPDDERERERWEKRERERQHEERHDQDK